MKNENELLNKISDLNIETKKEIINFLSTLNNQYNLKPLEFDQKIKN